MLSLKWHTYTAKDFKPGRETYKTVVMGAGAQVLAAGFAGEKRPGLACVGQWQSQPTLIGPTIQTGMKFYRCILQHTNYPYYKEGMMTYL